jgi:hypothetical protein
VNSESNLEEINKRLRRVEKLLEQLNALVQQVLQGSYIATIDEATKLVTAFSLPAIEALEAARRIVMAARSINDSISLSIIEAMSTCEPLTVSEITRRVRVLRGKASRNTVKQKLHVLIDMDIVTTVNTGRRIKYIMTVCP